MFEKYLKPKKKKSIEEEIEDLKSKLKGKKEKVKLEGELESLRQEEIKIKLRKLTAIAKGAKTGAISVGKVIEKTFRHTQPLGIDLRPIGNGKRKKRK